MPHSPTKQDSTQSFSSKASQNSFAVAAEKDDKIRRQYDIKAFHDAKMPEDFETALRSGLPISTNDLELFTEENYFLPQTCIIMTTIYLLEQAKNHEEKSGEKRKAPAENELKAPTEILKEATKIAQLISDKTTKEEDETTNNLLYKTKNILEERTQNQRTQTPGKHAIKLAHQAAAAAAAVNTGRP